MGREKKVDSPAFSNRDSAYEMKRIERPDDSGHGLGSGLNDGFSQSDSFDRLLYFAQPFYGLSNLIVIVGRKKPEAVDRSPAFHAKQFAGIGCLPSPPGL
jgi:hypothetical protein